MTGETLGTVSKKCDATCHHQVLFVLNLHISDKFLYHQNTTYKLLYENAHDRHNL
jgi:hypothetical protein